MGQGYSFFAVIFFKASSFRFRACLVKKYRSPEFSVLNAFILVAIVLVKDYINKYVREKYILQTFIR